MALSFGLIRKRKQMRKKIQSQSPSNGALIRTIAGIIAVVILAFVSQSPSSGALTRIGAPPS
ncbi:MAG TPA: hypothetical protein VLC46_18095 [Thermoanaerobaculia bacterium]|nr:hypothetical protein [Thermoanaerobaculia bacterium]